MIRRHAGRAGSRAGGRPAPLAGAVLSTLTAVAALCLFAIFSSAQPPPPAPGSQASPDKPPAKASGAKGTGGAATAAGAPAAGQRRPKASAAAAPAPKAAAGAPRAGAAPGAAGRPAPQANPANPAKPAIGAPPEMGNIDQILEGDEEVLSGNVFTYDPGNRRDPFKSLLIAPDRPEFRGPRPEGIPGLLIDEIDLRGIFRTARGYVAQVNASNQKKSYLLKEGDQLYDGDVVSIGKNEVVFKQIVQDPTALKPFREVVKSLNPG